MTDTRWGIYIDIEGFGSRYDETMRALAPLNALMEGIYEIGNKVFFDDVQRLFAHQFGDGFIIVSCFAEESLDRPISIAITLMRYVLAKGGMAKASISEGGFSDIKGCYPRKITDEEHDGRIHIGRGLMTLIPVMGTALINAVALDKKTPSGALLTIASEHSQRISHEFSLREIENGLTSVNWMLGEPSIVEDIFSKSGLRCHSESERIQLLRNYINENTVSPNWIRTTCYEQSIPI